MNREAQIAERIAKDVISSRLTIQDVIGWLKRNIQHLPNIGADDEDALHGVLVRHGIARDTNEDFEIVRRAMSKIMGEMAWTGEGFNNALMRVTASHVAQWEKMPKGWTEESLKEFWKTLSGTGDMKKRFYECVDKIGNTDIDDPESFCGSLFDKAIGNTDWRSIGRK